MSTPGTVENPYTVLLTQTSHGTSKITTAYETHRNTRAAAKHAELTNTTSSPGLIADPLLTNLISSPPGTDPATVDPRHNIAVWARPPTRVKALIAQLQTRLGAALPDLYFPQEGHLHMTVLEVTHSRTPNEVHALVSRLEETGVADTVAAYPASFARSDRVARLAYPMVTYDANAVALSFLPIANGANDQPEEAAGSVLGERASQFTYHHLRGAVFAAVSSAVTVGSRYVLPSAHMTIARFTTETPADPGERAAQAAALVEAVDAANAWLNAEVGADRAQGGTWEVGEEKGLEVHSGSCWYGYGGRTVRLGRGIASCAVRSGK